MHKVWSVARREYRAAVQTKAFILSLLVMPLICSLSIGIQVLIAKAEASETKHEVIVDRTGQLRGSLEAANAQRTAVEVYDPQTKERTGPIFELRFVEPSVSTPEAIVAQRLELSRAQKHGKIDGFVEIGPDVFEVVPRGAPSDDRHDVRFQSDKLAEQHFSRWAIGAINDAIREHRFEHEAISTDAIRRIQTPAPTRHLGLTTKNPRTGAIEEPSEESRLASFFLPGGAVVLMFMLVLVGAVPAMGGLIEEKQQRIVEVLLGCLSPFDLMLGKLLGIVLVSMTTSAVYLSGTCLIAARFGMASLMPPALIAWFVFFTVLAVLVFGSLFMAVGAAASDMKEAQSLQTPLMMILTLPLLLLAPVLQDPGGRVAIIGSFLPLSAPMLMTARLASPAVVPAWHPIAAAVGVVVTSIACVWAAGRVFRVGLLMQGKGARLGDLARWVFRS